VRKRKRSDTMIRCYKYRIYDDSESGRSRPLPESFWVIAREQQRVWNILCGLHAGLLTSLDQVEDKEMRMLRIGCSGPLALKRRRGLCNR